MVYNEVKSVLEYKNVNDIDYVYVEWKDSTTTWEKMSNLNCRELVCRFFRNAIEVVQENERVKEEELKKKKEEDLLRKMISRNMDESAKVIRAQNEILTSLVNSSGNSLLKGLGKTQTIYRNSSGIEPFIQSSSKSTFPKFDVKNPSIDYSHNATLTELESQRGSVKSQKLMKVKNNSIAIKPGNIPSISIVFYHSDSLLPLIFEDKDIVAVYHKTVATYLHSLYLSQNKTLHVVPSADVEDALESQLEVYMKIKSLSLVCKSQASFWIISTRCNLGNFFNISLKSRFIIFSISKSAYLERLFQLKGIVQQDTLWLGNSFKLGISMLTDEICKNLNVPPSKHFFILGDIKSTFISHLSKVIQRAGRMVNSIQDANAVLIQESYLRFLQFVPGFYGSLKNFTKFFIVKCSGVEEILPSGGIVTFADEYVEKAELLEVADFIKKILAKRNWDIKIRYSTYLTLKHRLSLQTTAIEHINSVKVVYKTFKAKICDFCGESLRDHLEMTHFRTHRYFIEVTSTRIDTMIITIDEATKLVDAS